MCSFSHTYHYYEPYTYASNYTDYEEEDHEGWDLVPGNYEELVGDDEGNSSQGNDYADYMGGVRLTPLTTCNLAYLTKISKKHSPLEQRVKDLVFVIFKTKMQHFLIFEANITLFVGKLQPNSKTGFLK